MLTVQEVRSARNQVIREMPSMSAPGSPGDNALAENFFSIFKTECIYLERPKTPEEAEFKTKEFLDYYNYQRIQTRRGLTPYESAKCLVGPCGGRARG